ncbi:MAG: hypothetical protein JWP81_2840 [Ferruginibacter sp.]|nr:hypothetical protein [Ferruginibacter sp.]
MGNAEDKTGAMAGFPCLFASAEIKTFREQFIFRSPGPIDFVLVCLLSW